MNPMVTAIVVTHNSANCIQRTLKALDREVHEVEGDIIVHDNNSRDSTINLIRSQFRNVEIIASRRNLGFGAANNISAKAARGKYLLFSNPDFMPDAGMLKTLIGEFQKNSDSGAACARVRNADGTFQPTCRKLPTMSNIFLSRGSLPGKYVGGRKSKSGYTLGDFRKTTPVPAVSATCLLIEREFFISLGGFDERFFLFMEDTDLSARIAQAGRKIYFVPAAGGVHDWGKGADISFLKRQWYHHNSVWKYFLKYFPNGFTLFLLPMALSLNFLMTVILHRRNAKPKRDD